MSIAALPDLNGLPAEALRALILAQHEQLLSTENKLTATEEQLLSREREIEHLKLLLVKLHRMQFGRKSEKLQRQIEQLELRLEELESNGSEREPEAPKPAPVISASTSTAAKRARAGHYRLIYRGKLALMCRRKRYARNARVSCASWGRTSRRCWSTCPPVSW